MVNRYIDDHLCKTLLEGATARSPVLVRYVLVPSGWMPWLAADHGDVAKATALGSLDQPVDLGAQGAPRMATQPSNAPGGE